MKESSSAGKLGLRTRLNRGAFGAKTAVVMRRERAAAAYLAQAERLSPAELEGRARQRTMALARHAYEQTDFYRRLYSEAGLTRADLERPENLEALPLLRKEAVRAHGEEMRARELPAERFLRSVTGGSTGSPLVVYNDRLAPHAAMWWRVYRWWGVHPGDDTAFVYRQKHAGIDAVKEYLTWWPTRHLLLDARDMDDAAVDRFLRDCRRVRPRLMVGYVEGVVALAKRLQDRGMTVAAPHAISVTSSVLHPGQREFMERVMGAPVYDTYRSAEVPWMAAECRERSGLHVQADIRHLEIVDDTGLPVPAGETGAVAVTDLTNRAFPLIRYAIGDRSRALAGTCGCGMTLPRIGAIEGRVADSLLTPTGTEIVGGFSALFNKWPTAVQQFQIHQYADHAVELRYVPGVDIALAEHAVAEVCATLGRLLHGEVEIRAVRRQRIEHDGGKARLVRSEIAAEESGNSATS
ncbi:phenylacetate--CoA ligase family protein [Pseudactinotalea sp.]|uniref:phenylacetate--CoA ligase family protein n=1 Tax=Pseudactinotalea sp. TaxID=1926260 RepID=UPI003B3A2F0A